MNELSDIQIAYLAGLIDGEGYVSIMKTKHKRYKNGIRIIPIITVSNISKDLLEGIQKELGGGQLICQRHYGKYKDCYQLRFHGSVLKFLLPKLIPFLRLKREAANKILEYYNHR